MGPFDTEAPFIRILNGALDDSEAAALIARIDESAPKTAPINTLSGPRVNTRLRNNERVIFDDVELMALVESRLRPDLPESIHGWRYVGLNERVRCYRYRPGMRFGPHQDGAFERTEDERSFYTLLVYLNEVSKGGDTVFFVKPEVRVSPAVGKALLFQHPLVHEGEEVLDGVKYVLRSDLMYRKPTT